MFGKIVEKETVKKVGVSTTEAVVEQDVAGYFIARARIVTEGVYRGVVWHSTSTRTSDRQAALVVARDLANSLL